MTSINGQQGRLAHVLTCTHRPLERAPALSAEKHAPGAQERKIICHNLYIHNRSCTVLSRISSQ